MNQHLHFNIISKWFTRLLKPEKLHVVCVCKRACALNYVRLFVTPWTAAHQAPLSIGFSRQEYWSRLPFPSPGKCSWPRNQICVSCISCIGRWVLYQLSHRGSPKVPWPLLNHTTGITEKGRSSTHPFQSLFSVLPHTHCFRLSSRELWVPCSHSHLSPAGPPCWRRHCRHCLGSSPSVLRLYVPRFPSRRSHHQKARAPDLTR